MFAPDNAESFVGRCPIPSRLKRWGIKLILRSKVWQFYIFLFLYFFNNIAIGLETNNYYGNYDVATKKPWRFATSLSGPHVETWVTPVANKPYKIAVLVPQIQDSYWLGVNYELIQEAKQLGITLKIFDAGGYEKGEIQRKQLTEDVLKEKVDGIILASIFYDKLDRFIAQIDKMGLPIVSMINDILSPNIKAGVTTSYYEIGYKLGEFIIDDAKGKNIRIAFFPGPKQAVWATDTYAGFLDAIKENKSSKIIGKITIVAIQYEILTSHLQQQLVDKILEAKSDIDYIIGNAIAAKAASTILQDKYKSDKGKTKIISTYLLADTYELVKNKKVYAAVIDFNMDKARMALHLLVRFLNGEIPNKQDIKFPLRTEPLPKIVTKDNITDYKEEQLFAAKNFKPTYEVIASPKK
jgi:protein TorT